VNNLFGGGFKPPPNKHYIFKENVMLSWLFS